MQQLINQEQQPADYKSSVPETENYKAQRWIAQNTKTTTQRKYPISLKSRDYVYNFSKKDICL